MRWRIAVFVALLGIIATALIAIFMPASYEAKVDLFFTASDPSANVSERVAGYAPLVTNDFVTGSVVDQLRLPETPQQFAQHITVTSQSNSAVLTVAVRLPDAAQASAAANGVANSFVQLFGRLEGPPAPNVPPAVTAKLVQPAGPPVAATWPSVLTLVVGLVVAVVLGIAAAALRNALDPMVRSRDDLAALTGRPILAEVTIPGPTRRTNGSLDTLTSPSAAEFRRLRAVLRPAGNDHPLHTIVVSGATADPGRTAVSVHAATALARARSSVLLIEADLRHPHISHHFGLDTRTGLATVLAGSVPSTQATRTCGAGLHVLSAGTVEPGSEDLLGSPRMTELLAEMREHYDLVVLDTAPVLCDPDALELTSRTDGVVLVVGRGSTRKDDLREAVGLLDQVGTPLLGSVFTTASRVRSADGPGSGAPQEPAPPRSEAPPPPPTPSPTPMPDGAPAEPSTVAEEPAQSGVAADTSATTAELATRYRPSLPLRSPAPRAEAHAAGSEADAVGPGTPDDTEPSVEDAGVRASSPDDSGVPATDNGSKA